MRTIILSHEALRPSKCPIITTPDGRTGFTLARETIDTTVNQQTERRVRLTLAILDGTLANVPSNFCGATVDTLPDGSLSPYCSVSECEFNPVNNAGGMRRDIVICREDPS